MPTLSVSLQCPAVRPYTTVVHYVHVDPPSPCVYLHGSRALYLQTGGSSLSQSSPLPLRKLASPSVPQKARLSREARLSLTPQKACLSLSESSPLPQCLRQLASLSESLPLPQISMSERVCTSVLRARLYRGHYRCGRRARASGRCRTTGGRAYAWRPSCPRSGRPSPSWRNCPCLCPRTLASRRRT